MDDLEKNWKMYDSLCRRLEDDNLNRLLDDLGERLVVSPSAGRTERGNAYPGGLVAELLEVTKSMRKINEALEYGVSARSILKVGLLHAIGKSGDLSNSYFLDQDNEWRRETLEEYYKFNESMPKMTHAHRTLWLLQQYGVSLDRDEWEAISVGGGLHLVENRFYSNSKSKITKLLCSARQLLPY